MTAYILLTPSSGSPAYKFPVIESGYNVTVSKAQTENMTIGGIDVAMGQIHEIHEYIIKVRHGRWIVTTSGSYQQVADDYGLLSDLEYLYTLNDPQGTPSNVITMVDHYGVTKLVYFVGDFPKVPITTIIDGGGGIFYIPCRFRVIPS